MPARRIRLEAGPLYTAVKDHMMQRMVEGIWEPGQRLPAETELARDFGVSQGTVRKALDELATGNLVVRRQGQGTFVNAHSGQRELFHYFHLVAKDGVRHLPASRVLTCKVRRATQAEAQKLDLRPRSQIVRIKRVREIKGRPVVVETVVVLAKRFPDLGNQRLKDIPNALYEYYEERYGVTIYQAVEHLRSVAAEKQEANLLGIDPGAPLLEIDRLALTLDRQPVEWRVSRCDTREWQYLSVLV